ncbi:MAG: hypothetical protein MRY83_10950 [Flavobacteriales bacterium]|nr:hypothetical protein [Flavobacteriales bacterium]
MSIVQAKQALQDMDIFFSDDDLLGRLSVIGYEKKFRWAWMATQLNTFIIASDYKDGQVNTSAIETHLTAAFDYASQNYSGWPRGLQSGLGVISILYSSNLTQDAIDYCEGLKSGKKWAGFTIPVVVDTNTGQVHKFKRNPMWGRIYYPHFTKLIQATTS